MSTIGEAQGKGKLLKISRREAGDLLRPQKDDPERCQGKMRNLIQRFLQDKQVSGGVSVSASMKRKSEAVSARRKSDR